jgi:hypothetical protein
MLRLTQGYFFDRVFDISTDHMVVSSPFAPQERPEAAHEKRTKTPTTLSR